MLSPVLAGEGSLAENAELFDEATPLGVPGTWPGGNQAATYTIPASTPPDGVR
jgi:hypothetical protein